MPRDLSDVLHYFLPELERAPEPAPADERPARQPSEGSPSRPTGPIRRATRFRPEEAARVPLSILGVPIGERNVVHAALAWSLAIETARLGGSTAIVAPDLDRRAALWPGETSPSLGTEIVYCPARDLGELLRTATGLAEERGKTARRGGIIFTCIPPAWLDERASTPDSGVSIRWLLHFTSPRRADASATFESVKRWVSARPGLEVGITIQGVRSVAEARAAFDDLARTCEERLGVSLVSYGLLVDDLAVHRAVAAGRPVDLGGRKTPAARALMDVARLLYEDARSRVLG